MRLSSNRLINPIIAMIRSYQIILTAAAFLSFTSISAQSVSKTHSLIAYSNFAYSNESKNEIFFKENLVKSFESRYDLGYFSPAFTFYNENGNFQELEISRIKFGSEAYDLYENQSIGNYTSRQILSKTTNISFRYEYAYKIKVGDEASKLNLYIGLSGNPYFLRENFASNVSTDVSPKSQSQLGVAIGAVPRITYNITSNWFLDLNLPISVVDFAFIRSATSNPTRPIEFREINSSELVLFPRNLLLRFGVGLKI